MRLLLVATALAIFPASGIADDSLPEGAIARFGSLAFRNERPTQSLEFSPDGRFLAGGSFNGAVRVWDAETGRMVWEGGGSGGG